MSELDDVIEELEVTQEHASITASKLSRKIIECEKLKQELDQCLTVHAKLNDECEKVKANYSDLIMQVARKYGGETRHETAKRYITEAEQNISDGSTKVDSTR